MIYLLTKCFPIGDFTYSTFTRITNINIFAIKTKLKQTK